VGYLKKPDLADVDAEGWFETGDLATMDGDGYIRITGRTKDVIIRGGENIPVVEVEELLYQHPDVSAAAIVGMPDVRLGERACCFLILSAGATLTFDEMVGYLLSKGLTKTYLPERLEIVSEMPRTASGKIQKFHLRETLQR
jgi:cyclohexanecarboxylate-CoA ligase